MKSAPRVMVTGHAGYIGVAMVRVLIDAGYDVVGLDSMLFDGCDFGPYECLIPQFRKDVRDITPEDLHGLDAIVHLAALCNDPLGDLNPELTLDIDYRASVRLARLAKDAGVGRFLFSSSCSMYGAAGDDILDKPRRCDRSRRMRNQKSAPSKRSRNSRRRDSVRCSCATPRATEHPRGCVRISYSTILPVGRSPLAKIRIMSDGTPWRPIVHIDDVANAFLAALQGSHRCDPQSSLQRRTRRRELSGPRYR